MRAETLLDVFERMPTKAKLLVVGYNKFDILEDIGLSIDYCESPIEIIFLTAYEIYRQMYDNDIFMQPQTEIECGEKTYFADFTIEFDELVNHEFKEDFKLIIECDGYEFHQKTKKQVDYDNKREYDLKMQGYEILRFSGSEIYNNPFGSVEKVLNYIEEKAYD